MKVSKTLHYNSSTQEAGAKLYQDLGVFTGVVDSWSTKNKKKMWEFVLYVWLYARN